MPLAVMLLSGVSLSVGDAYASDDAFDKKKDDATLSTIVIKAQKGSLPDDGYRATKTRVGKVLQDPHDIPQAITTVTNKIMEEQQVGSLREALRNVSGLTFNAAEGGRSGDNMMLRGFYTFGDMYLDGIRDTAQYNRETFNLEQVDVLRGSAAMLFGRGQAGGVINQVSKTPMLEDRNKLTASIGSQGYKEVTADLNKKLNDDTAVRINLMNRDEGSWRSNPATGTEPELHRQGFAASLSTGIGLKDEFTLSHISTETRDTPDYGINFDTNTLRPSERFPASYFWGVDGNFDDSDTDVTTLSHVHRFKPGTELRTQLRHGSYERAYWAKTPNLTTAPAATGIPGGNQTRNSDYRTDTLQSDFSTRLNLWGMKHEVLTGFEYLHEDSHRNGLRNLSAQNTPPNYSRNEENATGAVNFKGDSYAVYAQDSIEFMPKWKAILGARYDKLKATYSNATSPKLNFGESSIRTGLSWEPNENTHYYLSWSDSFSPTADLYQISGGELPAERSKVTELGAKWLFLDGDVTFRTALYQAKKDWERNTDLESTAALLSRKRHTNGIEFELAGKITPKWEIFAGLALMQAKVDEQYDGVSTGQTFAQYTQNGTRNGGQYGGTNQSEIADANEIVYTGRSNQVSEGQRPRNTPKYTVNLWTTYQFLPEWKAGLGLESKGSRYGYSVGTCGAATQNAATGAWSYSNCSTSFQPRVAPSYVRWDGMLSYEQKNYTLRLNVQNLLNKLYYDSIYDNGGFTVPGTNRKVILTGEYKF